MSIDKLPDDCLLHVFKLFDKFETLLICSQVCQRWKYLVLQRLSNVKYLTDNVNIKSYPVSKTILYREDDRLDLIELSEWFPKLKILESNSDAELFWNSTIEGLLLDSGNLDEHTFSNSSLKMLAVYDIFDFFANGEQGPMLTQLYVKHCSLSKFFKHAKYFPNLKRLHLGNFILDDHEDDFYTGPVLKNLEILEMVFHTQYGTDYNYYGFSLADYCPVLKSAYHFIYRDSQFFVNSGIQNHLLEDLVLQFGNSCRPDWSLLRRVLSKYPNLKHLAIRADYDTGISNENIAEILNMLPLITLIDIRNSIKVDENSIEYIDRYCRRHNRSISLYYQKRPKITKNWPYLSTKTTRINRGFDFMKHCFLKDYNKLPYLLDPDE